MAWFAFGVFLRCFSFVLQPFHQQKILCLRTPLTFLINTVPSFFLFSSYMCLLMLWVQTYRGAYEWRNMLDVKFQWSVILANIIMYCGAIIFFALDFHEKNQPHCDYNFVANTKWENGILILVSAMYLITTIGFFVSGYLIFRSNYAKNLFGKTVMQRYLLRKIGVIGVLICLCFLIRALLTTLQLHFTVIGTNPWSATSYYLFLDVLPLSLMLTFMYTIRKVDVRSSENPNLPTSPLIVT
eukprot:TRINITY_DN5797_c0_g1_i2.p1 TRINITY_DN5797_c0_g1~~TRINITY_DN5797_c0_g1_i2.p1  ORF type:complete len:241 (+),score=14.70 TRINITY_DN5797_c0_g1_i2:235-957(+)